MSLNKDGLKPGQIVDHDTMLRVEAERKKRLAESKKRPGKRDAIKNDEQDK